MRPEPGLAGLFLIDSLPRVGSTTLARLLSCHPHINCIIEPFHPKRYDGQFHSLAVRANTVVPPLTLIQTRWNGLKHVWYSDGRWPFGTSPELNLEIIKTVGVIVFVRRRNLLKRFISEWLSSRLNFWVGTRDEFTVRLGEIAINLPDAETIRRNLVIDRLAIEERRSLIAARGKPFIEVCYEDMFGQAVTPASQWEQLDRLIQAIGHSGISEEDFKMLCVPLLDREKYKWAAGRTYEQSLPLRALDQQVGSDESGWLCADD